MSRPPVRRSGIGASVRPAAGPPSHATPLKVLVVENSASARELLVHILRGDDGIGDVRTAVSGEDALRILAIWRPNVVTMDINLTGMNGFETTERIMESQPLPIVVISGHWNPEDTSTAFRTMEAGALTALGKPPAPTSADFDRRAAAIVQTVKAMARVRPMRRRRIARKPSTGEIRELESPPPPRRSARPAFLAIGGSTGAPPVIKTLLAALPRPFPAPVLIVQHMSPGFVGGMARWLTDSTGLPVRIPENGTRPEPGVVYLAPDHRHLAVERDGRLVLRDAPAEHSMRPAISFLFRSLAASHPGRVLPVLLTGMGEDGAVELGALRETGCETVAQDEASSVVYGMPARAAELNAAVHVLPPDRIAKLIGLRFRS